MGIRGLGVTRGLEFRGLGLITYVEGVKGKGWKVLGCLGFRGLGFRV